MEAFIKIFLVELREGRTSEDFVCAVTWCFQPTSSLFMNYFKMNRDEVYETVLKH